MVNCWSDEMLDYDSIARALKENSDVIKGKDKQKAQKILHAYAEKDCDTMERIVGYWKKSSSPILSLFTLIDNKLMNSPRRKTVYKSLI